MPAKRSYLLVSVVATMFFAVLFILSGALIAQAEICSQDDWCWDNPLPQGLDLQGIWGNSSNDIFVIGEEGTILHYDGNVWSAMSSGTTDYLNGIWGSSSNDAFALGEEGTILHYDGNVWSAMSSGTTDYLYGIWGSSGNDIFAVGRSGTILHYNGSVWSAMDSGTTQYLFGIWGSSSNDVFAVGGAGAILHRKAEMQRPFNWIMFIPAMTNL